MKRSITWLTAAILIAACAISCGESETESRLSVKPKKLDFGSGGGTQKFTVTAENTTWTVSASGKWIGYEINPENSEEVIVTVEATDYLREGYIYIESKDAGDVSVQISQKGAVPSLTADKSVLRFSLDGGSKPLTVRAVNVIWAVFPSENWIGYALDDDDENIVNVTVTSSAIARTGSVRLIGEGVPEVKIDIIQEDSGGPIVP